MLYIFVDKSDSSSFQLTLIAIESIPGCVFTLGKSYFPTGFSHSAHNQEYKLAKDASLIYLCLGFLISAIAFTVFSAAWNVVAMPQMNGFIIK